ncbi:hypothetical protein [Peredibacter starrii]|uniref:Uncharacterized protein n=1 Tax=Peredibacter starrii TaxID=28202 RepID=A0AAX4HJD6_9BACT|nr:hypothetical protein [Peredibacter starrii]WPU63337.1 hypothetical protein SOO65_11635 [Peredibacter starrii]
MNKQFLILVSLLTLNLLTTGWLLYQYKNAPPVEENIRVRVGQSDRFIAESANEIEKLKGEIQKLQNENLKLNEGLSAHSQLLQAHDQELRNK